MLSMYCVSSFGKNTSYSSFSFDIARVRHVKYGALTTYHAQSKHLHVFLCPTGLVILLTIYSIRVRRQDQLQDTQVGRVMFLLYYADVVKHLYISGTSACTTYDH